MHPSEADNNIGMAKEGMWHHLGSPANTAGAQLHLCPEMQGSISR